MAQPPKTQPSGAFLHREFNGETLLEELAELVDNQVTVPELATCARDLESLNSLRVTEAVRTLKEYAAEQVHRRSALAGLLLRWSAMLKSDAEVPLLTSHLRRMALAVAIISFARKAASQSGAGP